MTMQIDSTQTLGGVPILEVRRFFRQVVAYHHNSFGKEWLVRELRLSDEQGDRVLEDLASQGYISLGLSQDKDVDHQITELARELVRSSAAKRISRRTAEDALQGLVSRAEAINLNPKYLYSVCSIVVFGSYLNGNDRLGDLDVAIELSPRIQDADERTKAHLRYARESGRRFSNFTDELYWAEAEVYQVLKARRRTVSIQPWYAFLRMDKKQDFQHHVVMGDVDKIAQDLKDAEKKRSIR
jgi:predicted nucleotidyltransferase